MSLFTRVTGLSEATQTIERLQDAAQTFGHMQLVVGSTVAYAYGIEFGRDRSGRLRRRAGGAYMVREGLRATRGQIPGLVLAELKQGTKAGKNSEDALRRTLLGAIQSRTPVRTGKLRSSFIVRRAR